MPWRYLYLVVVALCAAGGCTTNSDQAPFDLSQATYVGSQVCAQCHQEQAELYKGSHHDMAMQPANERTVRANFNNVQIEHHGIVSTAYRDGDRFMIRTEGPDGKMHDYEVKYTFGWEPLQQYMVEFPAPGRKPDGTLPRIQVLRLSWDTERNEWFYLPPPDVPEKLDPNDDLHWTGIAQRWNTMCAECHSTNYQKNFIPSYELKKRRGNQSTEELSAGTDASGEQWWPGEYHSTFSEINVACEACHGPGSVHVELARKWFPGWNRQRGYGLANLKLDSEHQIQACAPCHSRRDMVYPHFRPDHNYYDHFVNAMLHEPIYYPDGQILDEDYVHGSFIQSKMYHKGIRCTDCHDPHSARLKQEGNAVCTSCHQHPAAKYDTIGHHFHQPGSPGAQCVNCHMPATVYMSVDARRDHSLRIPRPDLSTQLESPNACTGCHLDPERVSPEKRERLKLYQDWMAAARDGDEEVAAEIERVNQWCAEACEKWYGTKDRGYHFGVALDAAQEYSPEAVKLVKDLLRRRGYEAPAIARASALELLPRLDPNEAAYEAGRAANDQHPLVRVAAARALIAGNNPTRNIQYLESLLRDPVRSVRVEAARTLLDMPRELLSPNTAPDLRRALEEMTEGLKSNNDRAGAHMALALIAEGQNRLQQAIQHYENAIAVEPHVSGPRTNLAALLERNLQSNPPSNEQVAQTIRERIERLRSEELELLKRDAELLPSAAPIRYRYGLALYLAGQAEAATTHLVAAAELEPREVTYAQAAAMLFEHLKKWPEAVRWAEEAVRRDPNDPTSQAILERIRQSAKQAAANDANDK